MHQLETINTIDIRLRLFERRQLYQQTLRFGRISPCPGHGKNLTVLIVTIKEIIADSYFL